MTAASAESLTAAQADAQSEAGKAWAEAVTHHAGRGLEAQIGDQTYRLGTAAFVSGITGSDVPADALPGISPVYLGSSAGWLACLAFTDTQKTDAPAVVAYFKSRGQRVVLLSGDSPAIVSQVAASLQMDEAQGGMLPDQKLAYVQQLQQQGAVVVMVGDGLNDAAVLRGADVSFAMGSGAALAQSHADAVLLSAQLTSLMDASIAATACMRVIRQNLAWATLYNLLAIPAAAFGLLTPWMAGLGMSASSALVVANALRLEAMPTMRKAR
jgi:Cu2+-exporting ATPase